jgi:hypothetical protein
MRRSFRTHRLCAIPGVSPRAGMRCPVGALRTPHQHRAFPRSPHKYAQRSGIGPERALEANTKNPSRTARKPLLPRASSASAGSIPRSPHRQQAPGASPSTPPSQNRCEPPGVCGVPSERTGCVPYPGFHPGLVCGAPLGHSERLTFPRAPTASASPRPQRHHHNTPGQRRLFFLNGDNQTIP